MKNITIAIDGYSSTGKSTLAKQLANHLGYVYVDSGAMYRAITYFAMQNGYINKDNFDITGLVTVLPEVEVRFKFNEKLGFAEVYLNGDNIERAIRTMEVSSFVSKVAAVPEVRYQMVKIQKQLGKDKGVVMDGRDIGTVVFPEAELKIFMNASAETRAKRRYFELIERNEDVNYQEVLRNVQERDYIDSHRKDSPLLKAKDAIEIDNSNLTKEEQFQKALQLANMTLEGME